MAWSQATIDWVLDCQHISEQTNPEYLEEKSSRCQSWLLYSSPGIEGLGVGRGFQCLCERQDERYRGFSLRTTVTGLPEEAFSP